MSLATDRRRATHNVALMSMEVHISVAFPTPGWATQLLEAVCQRHFGADTAPGHRKGCGCGRGHTILAS